MKKLLGKLESIAEIKLLEVNESKGVYGGSYSYDTSYSNDTSEYYDCSVSADTSTAFDSCP